MNGTVRHENLNGMGHQGVVDEAATTPRSCPCKPPRLKIGWGWVVSVATAILYTFNYGYLYSYGLLMVELMDEFGSSTTETGKSTIPYPTAFVIRDF